jgi:hypothetical protein
MTTAFMRSRHAARIRVLAWSTVLAAAAACGSDQTAGPSSPPASDSPATPDSVPHGTLPRDTLPTDSSSATTPVTQAARAGVPYGPYNLMDGYTTWAWGPAPFTASLNGNTFANGVIKQIDAARAINHRLMLSLTDGPMSRNIVNGKFDLATWKLRMDAYNTPEIKAAVARGYADGTIIGSQILNEPMRPGWGGVFNKALLDEMCGYAKSIFPTVPAGPIVVHWWLMTEEFRVCDFIVDQYTYDQPPLGWGTPGGKGDVVAWRDAALAEAKRQGISIAFSMNILGGAPKLPGCPLPQTAGPYTDYPGFCRMTANQIRDFGQALGPYGCALFLWMYDKTAMSKADNVQAFKDVAATLATSQNRSCRRTG